MARREEHGAVEFSKRELAAAIMGRLGEALPNDGGWEALEAAVAPRPVLNHIVQRVIKPLAEAPADRPRRRRA